MARGAFLQEGSPPVLTGHRLLFILAALGAAAYAPILAFPFLTDSYSDIPLSRVLGIWHNLHALAADPFFHFRWTYVLANSWIVQLFGMLPRPFYAASICFHVLCVWAVYATGIWSKLGWKTAAWAGAFFAVYEGHQGAVTLLADWPELFVTLFGCACFAFWVKWLEGGRWPMYALACVTFTCALFSNETGFVAAPLLALPVVLERRFRKRGIAGLIPFLLGSAVYAWAILASRPGHAHGDVTSASLLAGIGPWNVLARPWPLLFICGLAAAVFLLWRGRENWKMIAASFTWMILGLAADGYVTYLHREPMGQTYLASVGLAWLVGMALVKASQRIPAQLIAVIALVIAGANVGILWTKKHHAILQLAAPTDALVNATPYARGPIHLTCFPYPVRIAVAAAAYAGGELIVDGAADKVEKPHCVTFHYKDILGNVRQITIHSGI